MKANLQTIAVLIGNSDDRLARARWAGYMGAVHSAVFLHSTAIHYSGCSNPTDPWENAAWIAIVSGRQRRQLERELRRIAATYEQDSVALVVGDSILLPAAGRP